MFREKESRASSGRAKRLVPESQNIEGMPHSQPNMVSGRRRPIQHFYAHLARFICDIIGLWENMLLPSNQDQRQALTRADPEERAFG